MTHQSLLGRFVGACALALALSPQSEIFAQTQSLPVGSHTAGVAVARFSPDGQLVVTGSFDRTLQIHSAVDGKLLRTLAGHQGQVLSLAITPDGRRIFSGGRDNALHVWDMYIPTPIAQLAGHAAAVHAVAVSADDAWIATGSADNSLKLFRRAEGKLLFDLAGHRAAIDRIAVKGDSAQLATGDAQGEVRLWNPVDGGAVGALGAHSGGIVGLAYHPSASTLMTAGGEGTVKLWALPLTPPKLLPESAAAVTAVAISADGSLVFTGAADATVRVASGATSNIVRVLEGQSGPPSALALSNDASLLASGSAWGEIRIWNAADGAALGALLGHAGKVNAISIAAQKNFITSAGDDGTIRMWRMPAASLALAGHTLPIQAITVSGDGKMIASGSADKSVRMFSAADGVFVRALAGHGEAVTAVAFAADNTQLATGDALGEVRLWSAADGAPQGMLLAHPSPITSIMYSPDGKQLHTTSADGTWKTWQLPLAPPRTLATFADSATQLALSADGKQLVIASADGKLHAVDPTAAQAPNELSGQAGAPSAVATAGGLVASANSEGEIRLWSAADGAGRLTLLGHTGVVHGIDISPKGDVIASAGADGTLRLWKPPAAPKLFAGNELAVEVVAWSSDRALVALGGVAGGTSTIVVRNAATGALVATILGHEGPITALAFSADQTKLVSGSADKSARVWNLADPKFPEVAKFAGHTAPLTAVAVSPDGAQAFSAAADKTLRQWNVVDGAEVRTLAGHAQPVSALATGGAALFSASADGSVRGWKMADGAAAGNFPTGTAATCLAVSADGSMLAVGLADKSIKLLAAADGKPAATLTGLTAAPAGVAWSADGQRIAGASAEGVLVWNRAGVLLERFPAIAAPTKNAAFSIDGMALVAVDAKNTLQSLAPSLVQVLAAEEEFTSVAFTPDGTAIFAGAADGALGQYGAADLKPLKAFDGGSAAVTDIDLSADGKLLAAASADKAVQLWDLASTTPAPAIPPTKSLVLAEAAQSIDFAAGGARLVTAGGDNFVRIWDLASLAELQWFASHSAATSAVAVSPDGAAIYSAGSDKSVVASAPGALRAVAAADAKAGIAAAALSTDAKLLATASGGAVKLWDAATGTLAHELPAGQKPLASVAFRGDGMQLAAGGGDLHLYLWQLTPQGPGGVTKIPVPAAIARVCYDATGKRLAAACADGRLRVFDAVDGRLLEELPQTAASACLAFTADGQALVGAAGEQGYVQPLSLVRLISGHEGGATGVAFSPDGAKLFTSGVDKTVRVWNAADGTQIGAFAGAADAVTSLSLAASGSLLTAACADRQVLVWDVPAAIAAQPVAARFSLPHAAAVNGTSTSADGMRLATSDADGTVRVYDVATARELERFSGHDGAALAVALAADGKTLASGGADKTARIWSVSAQQVFIADPAKLVDAALAPNGTQFVTAGANDMAVRIWDAAGKPLRACAPATAALGRLAVRGDGAQIAGCDAQGKLLLWNAADGALTSTTDGGGPVHQLAYSRDGKQLVVAGQAHLRVYESDKLALLQENASSVPLLAAAFAPGGREIVSGADKQASVWANASPSATASLTGHQGPVYSVAISPDGKLAASASGDQSIRLWDTATGQQVRQLAGHSGAVYSVHFSDDGARLVSAGADGSARLWDVAGGTELKKLAGEPAEGERLSAAFDAAIAPSGQSVAVAGADGRLRVWNIASGKAAESFAGHTDAIYRVAYNKPGTRLYTCGHAGSMNAWDAASGQAALAAKLPAVAYYMEASGDGARMVAACADGKAYLIDLPDSAR